MVKIFLMGCLKKYFRVLKFFGRRTGDRPDPEIGPKKFEKCKMVKIFLMGCLKKYFI